MQSVCFMYVIYFLSPFGTEQTFSSFFFGVKDQTHTYTYILMQLRHTRKLLTILVKLERGWNTLLYFRNCKSSNTDYGHMKAKSLILCGPNSNSNPNPNPNKYLGFGYEGLVFCRNNGLLMENMDKGLTVPKWMLSNQQKCRKCPEIHLPTLKRACSTRPQVVQWMGISGFPRGRIKSETIFPIGIAH